MTQVELAERIKGPYVRVNELVNGKRRVTPSTVLRLARVLGKTARISGWTGSSRWIFTWRSTTKREIGEIEKIVPVLL